VALGAVAKQKVTHCRHCSREKRGSLRAAGC
jgi:hypothetical protein